MDPHREIYPNAPLSLVAAEVRYPFSPKLASLEAAAAVERLGAVFPLVEEGQPFMQVTVGPAGAESLAPTSLMGGRLLRMFTKGRNAAATITGTNAVVETTTYERFEAFQDMLGEVLTAIEEFGPPVGVERLGLRYIDEIRVPGITEAPGDWHPFVEPALVAATDLVSSTLAGAGFQPQIWQGVVQLAGPDDRGIQVRYGAGLGSAVNPNGQLRFPGEPDQRPAFLIDIDSFWAPAEIGDFSAASFMEVFQQLHEPLREVFERAVSDHLRDEVLRIQKKEA
jgi:uncharacterized protein (TIGR04255 family)